MYGSPKKQTWWKPIFPVSRFLASSIMAPLMRFLITVPHLVQSLEGKVYTITRILRVLVIGASCLVGLGMLTYLGMQYLSE